MLRKNENSIMNLTSQAAAREMGHLVEVASLTADGAKYLLDRADERNIFPTGIMEQIKSFSNILEKKEEKRAEQDTWNGGYQPVSNLVMTANIFAEEAFEKADPAINHVYLDIAVQDETAEFLRRFTKPDNERLEGNNLNAMDSKFNEWLAGHSIMVEDAAMCMADENTGKIRKDAQGKNQTADPVKMRELLEDKENGFAAFMANQGKVVEVRLQDYPRPQEAVVVR